MTEWSTPEGQKQLSLQLNIEDLRKGKSWRLPGLLYADDLFLCPESEEDLKFMVRHLVEFCRSSSLKVNGDKRKVVLSG